METNETKVCKDCVFYKCQGFDVYFDDYCDFYEPDINEISGYKDKQLCQNVRKKCKGNHWKPRKRTLFERLFNKRKDLISKSDIRKAKLKKISK